MTETKEPQQVIHPRLPRRLVEALGHYAVNRNIDRQHALIEILEQKLGNSVPK